MDPIGRLGTLFGVVMLVHQVGSFAGIWLGGWAAQATGTDRLLWTVDIVLALAAAALVMPSSGGALRARMLEALPDQLAQRRRFDRLAQ